MTDHQVAVIAWGRFDAHGDARAAADTMDEGEKLVALAVFDSDQLDTMHAANRIAVGVVAVLRNHDLPV